MINNTGLKKARELLNFLHLKPLTDEERMDHAVCLAKEILAYSEELKTECERKREEELHKMVKDPSSKTMVMQITDQVFRSKKDERALDQLLFLLDRFDQPNFLKFSKRLALQALRIFGKTFPSFFLYLFKKKLRQETKTIILPGEEKQLLKHIGIRKQENVRINLNHLGEAILGEEEAKKRLSTYLEDLTKKEIECVSIKISSIYSQINLLDWDKTLAVLRKNLTALYSEAKKNKIILPDGSTRYKFVYLDMEEYKDFHLTAALFKEVLSQEEFLDLSAGIVLQSYLPDSYDLHEELIAFAKDRVEKGGAPIKIRLVKGANMALEELESSLQGFPKAPYSSKKEVDANYKKMMLLGLSKENAPFAHLGIGSHNLFDIALGLVLRAENGTEEFSGFEMLEGMADPLRRSLSEITGEILLYCPAAKEEDFVNALAYLVRRLDENTAPDNFLTHLFDLRAGNKDWLTQERFFRESYKFIEFLSNRVRRDDKANNIHSLPLNAPFINEPNVDWVISENREWIKEEIERFKKDLPMSIPNVIGGNEVFDGQKQNKGVDPSLPAKTAYSYALANEENVKEALLIAKEAQKKWANLEDERVRVIMHTAANLFKKRRGRLIGAMLIDTAKPIPEGDAEVSEAIDFLEYYQKNRREWMSLKGVNYLPKGNVLVASPWNFPCSIPVGGIAASLIMRNAVLFKPAPEAILVGYEIAKLFWEAGVPKDVLQFIACEDDPVGTQLIRDPNLNTILLTGSTETAKLFMKLRPGLDLIAETGGKNAIIVSSLADRDLAIKNIIQSAFSFSGQKCSACSLVLLEAEVYDDPNFIRQLKDGVKSLTVGSAHNPSTKINPLITEPSEKFLKAMRTLEEGESWVLEPFQDKDNPRLISPGIKMGVKKDSFSFKTELFGPILSLVRVKDFKEALEIANSTSYGLTSGLQTLDIREQTEWVSKIQAGNLYVNRGITGAIVERQPFGGFKDSSFGPGIKAGGPNFLTALAHIKETSLPEEGLEMTGSCKSFFEGVDWSFFRKEDKEKIKAAFESYSFFWNYYFDYDHDPVNLRGQDNWLRYNAKEDQIIRVLEGDSLVDFLLAFGAKLICNSPLPISLPASFLDSIQKILPLNEFLNRDLFFEGEESFLERGKGFKQVRFFSKPINNFLTFLQNRGLDILIRKPLCNGRIELLNYLREIALSVDYHRYGNLGRRESEQRRDLKSPSFESKDCKNCPEKKCCND